MESITHSKPNFWTLLEFISLPFILAYFLLYPRDTVSDFVVCSALSFTIIALSKKIQLIKPSLSPVGKIDYYLATGTVVSFFCAWIYAYTFNKINSETAQLSILITILYIYYAWIQHFLAQRYTAVRIKQLAKKLKFFPHVSENLKAAILTGVVFGILHIPYPHLMLPAAIGGSVYAFYFLNTGRLWAVVLSHALVASAWIYWGSGSNAFEEFTWIFPAQ